MWRGECTKETERGRDTAGAVEGVGVEFPREERTAAGSAERTARLPSPGWT